MENHDHEAMKYYADSYSEFIIFLSGIRVSPFLKDLEVDLRRLAHPVGGRRSEKCNVMYHGDAQV